MLLLILSVLLLHLLLFPWIENYSFCQTSICGSDIFKLIYILVLSVFLSIQYLSVILNINAITLKEDTFYSE